MQSSMLMYTGIATATASLVFVAGMFGYLTPKSPSLYDRAAISDEVQNFLEKYPTASTPPPPPDCINCRPSVAFVYQQPDRTKYAYLWVTQSDPDPNSMLLFTVMCSRPGGMPEDSLKANGTRIENITDFLNSEQCPS